MAEGDTILRAARRIERLSDAEIRAVVESARRLMSESVERGRDDRSVYKRSGCPCPRCDATIRSRGQDDANRTTYWCPSCQESA